MAAITVTAEAAAVNVIPPVTAIAVVSGLFMFCQILPMALIAVDFTMLALQRKVSLIIMIKGP